MWTEVADDVLPRLRDQPVGPVTDRRHVEGVEDKRRTGQAAFRVALDPVDGDGYPPVPLIDDGHSRGAGRRPSDPGPDRVSPRPAEPVEDHDRTAALTLGLDV